MSSSVTIHPLANLTPESARFASNKFPRVDQAEAFPSLTTAQIERFREARRIRKVLLISNTLRKAGRNPRKNACK
jgi:hypothetical protein